MRQISTKSRRSDCVRTGQGMQPPLNLSAWPTFSCSETWGRGLMLVVGLGCEDVTFCRSLFVDRCTTGGYVVDSERVILEEG